MQYKIGRSFVKAIVKGGVFALPLILPLVPQAWLNLTIGTLAYMLLDYLQREYTTL